MADLQETVQGVQRILASLHRLDHQVTTFHQHMAGHQVAAIGRFVLQNLNRFILIQTQNIAPGQFHAPQNQVMDLAEKLSLCIFPDR